MNFPVIPMLAGLAGLACAETPPRITPLLGHPPGYGGPAVLRDFDRDGDLDILYLPSPSGIALFADGQGTVIENLGGREFARPRFTHSRSLGDGYATTGNFIADDQIDFLVPETSSDIVIDGAYAQRPIAIRFASPGGTEQRVPLAPFDQYGWFGLDLDADQAPELVQFRHPTDNSSELHILERGADGIFSVATAPVSLPLLDFGFDYPVLDVDHDGDLDLVARCLEGLSPIIIERTGPRTFSPAIHQPETDLPFSTWADLDGDGLPDLYQFESGSFSWQINAGGFAFEAPRQESPGDECALQRLHRVQESPPAAALPIFSRITADHVTLTTLRFGTWEMVSQSTLDHPAGFGVGEPNIDLIEDIDGDGHLDCLVRYRLSGGGRPVPRLAISWGGESGFSPLGFLHPPAPVATRPLAADIDQDGSIDLILGPDLDGFYHLLLNDGGGRFPETIRLDGIAPPAGTPTGTRIAGLHAGDIDGDSIPDLAIDYAAEVAGGGYRTACGIATGLGGGSFLPPALPAGSFDVITECPCGIGELVDWDGDGDVDAVNGSWRENLGGYFDLASRPLISGAATVDFFGNPTTIQQFSTGDLDGDGSLDIASGVFRIEPAPGGWGAPGETTAGIGFGDGFGGIATIAEFPARTAAMDFLGNPVGSKIGFADLNSDGHTDLAILEYKTFDFLGNAIATLSWRRNPGNGSRDPASWTLLPLDGHVFPSGEKLDFDGDGSFEWVSEKGYLKASPAGPLVSPTYHFSGNVDLTGSRLISAGDFDGDGDADFLIGDGHLGLVLVRNPLVDERSAITRALVASGVAGSLAGPEMDADGDGRTNEEELLTGTNPRVVDPALHDPFELGLQVFSPVGSLGFRLPSIAVGLAPSPSGLPYTPADLDLYYEVQHSPDLENWMALDMGSAELFIHGGGWAYLSLTVPCNLPKGFFRIHGEHRVGD